MLVILLTLLYTFSLTVIFFPAISFANDDTRTNKNFGTKMERLLHIQSHQYFGIRKPLTASAPETSGAYRTESQLASDQVLLARD